MALHGTAFYGVIRSCFLSLQDVCKFVCGRSVGDAKNFPPPGDTHARGYTHTHAQFMSLLGRRTTSSDDHELCDTCAYGWLRFRGRHHYRPFSDVKYHG